MEPLSFSEFYSGIRAHFSNNSWEYESYKFKRGNRAKVEFLIGHDVVKKAIANLAAKNTLVPMCAIFGPPARNSAKENHATYYPDSLVVSANGAKYPQMSKKIEVKATKKKGRILVAKERIEPGKCYIEEIVAISRK